MDADFCAQFIKVLHTQGTPGFSTLLCYDKVDFHFKPSRKTLSEPSPLQLLGDHVKVVVFSCSEYEARNYGMQCLLPPTRELTLHNHTGRFLVGILKDLWKWQQDEELYKQENRTKAGGKTVLLPGMQMKWSNKTVITPEDLLSWSALKTIMKKWHRKLGKVIDHSLTIIWTLDITMILVPSQLHTNWRLHACLQCHHRSQGDPSRLPSFRVHGYWACLRSGDASLFRKGGAW
jgi:hypothetical protein